MNYEYLLGMMENYETERIKPFHGKHHTATERIPDAFVLLVPEIIKILEKNLPVLCKENEGILILGMQPAGAVMVSEEAIDLDRTFDGMQPNYHFCCTLDYMVAPLEQLSQYQEHKNVQSLVIDFTAGEIMDAEYYASKLSNQKTQGTILGRINSRALSLSWAIVKIRQGRFKSAKDNLQASVKEKKDKKDKL